MSDVEITPEELAAYDLQIKEDEDAESALAFEDGGKPSVWVSSWYDFREALGTDLMALDTSKKVQWVPGAEKIIRARERQMWMAKQGEGKTQAALHLAAQVCEAGGRVMYVDVENDAEEMALRMQTIAASLEAADPIAERYAYLPDLSLKWMHEHDGMRALWAQSLIASDLLIIDSITRVLSEFGYDEDSNKDYARWMREHIDPIAKHGEVAVLLLDNMGRSGDHARGAISKEGLVEAVYKVSGGTKVTPDDHGTLTLKLSRSRSGKIAKHVAVESGGGSYGRLEAQSGSAPSEGPSAERSARRSQMKQLFADGDGGWVSLKGLKEQFPGKADNTLRDDLQSLINSGEIETWTAATHESKPGRGDHWRSRR
jgi:AAA domain